MIKADMREEKKTFLSIISPTYNRAYKLECLYESLCRQSTNDFEWIVVNDGSTDNTESIVKRWISDSVIKIRYFSQDNLGKPQAHNKGVMEARGEMITCVDSDDCLTDIAVEILKKSWKAQSGCVGMLAFRKHANDKPITILKKGIKYTTLADAYRKNGLRGDTMLIYKSDIIKKYSFPYIKGEKFIPEGYLYNKLDREGNLLVVKEYIYVCEYLEDGYTRNVDKLLFDNYKSYLLHIKEREKNEESIFYRFLDAVRYDSVMIAHREKGIIKNAVDPLLSILGMPIGAIVAKKRYSRFM